MVLRRIEELILDSLTWTYRFFLSNNRVETVNVSADPATMALSTEQRDDLPEWTRLDVHQCSNCPLSVDTHPTCPLAAALVDPIAVFSDVVSYESVTVEVITPERVVNYELPAQNAVGSLMGLVMATSGCPHTRFFRPMARFHLPLSTQTETLYRAASMYMLAQYFRRQDGGEADLTFQGLSAVYAELETLNAAMARRLRTAIERDAAVNAVVILDFFAKNWAFSVEEHLSEIEPLFEAYLSAPDEPSTGGTE